MNPIYLDHAATTPVRPEVRDAMEPFLARDFGNPSSMHAWGRQARSALEDARERVAQVLGAHPDEVVFVRGGTESDNLAVRGRALAVLEEGILPLIIHSALEHPAVLESADAVRALGGEVTVLPVDPAGHLDLNLLGKALRERPALLSMLWGQQRNWDRAASARHRAARSGARSPRSLRRRPGRGEDPHDHRGGEGPDLLTVTGHKIYGPKGTGLLVVRMGVQLRTLLFGGGQERGLRPGTEDVAGALGLACALELAVLEREAEAPRLTALRSALEQGLRERIPDLRVHGERGERAPHVASFGFQGVDQQALLAGLDLEGIAVSGGSACSSGTTQASHVLRALYGKDADGWASIRFSLGRSTGAPEVERAIAVSATLVERLESLTASESTS